MVLAQAQAVRGGSRYSPLQIRSGVDMTPSVWQLLVLAVLAATKSGKPRRSPATKKGRCRLHGGANGSGAPPGKRNGQYRHGERTRAAIAEQRKFSALLKMLRAGLT